MQVLSDFEYQKSDLNIWKSSLHEKLNKVTLKVDSQFDAIQKSTIEQVEEITDVAKEMKDKIKI